MKTHTPTPWHVFAFDGVTIGPANGMVGVAATAPDPLCKEHYKGGPFGGNYFAPEEDVDVQKANARFIVRAVNTHAELLGVVEALVFLSDHGYHDPSPLGENSTLVEAARDVLKKVRACPI